MGNALWYHVVDDMVSERQGQAMDKYILERDGQLDFFKVFLPRVNPALDIDEILADNNDGVINGNLLEFKLHVHRFERCSFPVH